MAAQLQQTKSEASHAIMVEASQHATTPQRDPRASQARASLAYQVLRRAQAELTSQQREVVRLRTRAKATATRESSGPGPDATEARTHVASEARQAGLPRQATLALAAYRAAEHHELTGDHGHICVRC